MICNYWYLFFLSQHVNLIQLLTNDLTIIYFRKKMNLLQTLSAPLGRTLLALIFFISGVNKVFSYAGTQGYMEAFNRDVAK